MIGIFVKERNRAPNLSGDPDLDNFIWPKVSDIDSVEYLNFIKQLTLETNPVDENYNFWMYL